ncbi:MAG TPA: polysaccharide deacetylase family protein [Candidatus Polarisedimenticolia bacterium]|nr:polysaccharide deacetylase family protein [Candidatus Polarisedimenticolia bacterium]
MIETSRSRFSVPVFMYHDLARSPERVPASHRPYVLTTDRFHEQLEVLVGLGFRGGRLDAHLEGANPNPMAGLRHCIITFDDGHASNFTEALPILLKAGFQATFFITVGWIGKAPYMDWNQLKALAASGMEIGSHSMTHRPPATLSPAELRVEMRDSRRMLEDRLGLPVTSASSPTGFFNSGMIAAAREAGYRALCSGRIALWRDSAQAFGIPRLPIKASTTTSSLRRMAEGDRSLIGYLRAMQVARNGLKRALGVNTYLRLRRLLLRDPRNG